MRSDLIIDRMNVLIFISLWVVRDGHRSHRGGHIGVNNIYYCCFDTTVDGEPRDGKMQKKGKAKHASQFSES